MPHWLILGDFNLIYKIQYKNNGRINRGMMTRFKRAIDHLEIKEINLVRRKFTWSNRQNPPIMSRIDRAFYSPAWEDWHANPVLQACSSSTSDHCPLLLAPLITPQVKPRFRFETFWVDMLGFFETVQEAWSKETPQTLNHLFTLHVKLSRTAKALRSWSRSLMSHCKLSMTICREVIEQLEKTQEQRVLTQEECMLIKTLKHRLLSVAAIEKCRAHQKSRITWLRKWDANTKFFQIMANIRKQKNFINALQTDEHVVIRQEEKHEVIFNHFLNHIGAHVPRSCALNLAELEWLPQDLADLEIPFVEEVKRVIMEAPKEKAPCPDGYIGTFFTHCWGIIKEELLKAIDQFFLMN
jgi:hypothetical protein